MSNEVNDSGKLGTWLRRNLVKILLLVLLVFIFIAFVVVLVLYVKEKNADDDSDSMVRPSGDTGETER